MVYYLPLLLEARFSWKNKRNCDERCPSILSGNVRSRESWWTNTLYIGIWPSWNDLSRRWFRFKSAFELKSKSILQIQCWTNTCKWMSVGALEVDISLWDVTLTFTTPSPCSLPVPPLRPMLLRFSFFFFSFFAIWLGCIDKGILKDLKLNVGSVSSFVWFPKLEDLPHDDLKRSCSKGSFCSASESLATVRSK